MPERPATNRSQEEHSSAVGAHMGTLLLTIAVGLAGWGNYAAAADNDDRTAYLPTWESLDARPTPSWFVDAKFDNLLCKSELNLFIETQPSAKEVILRYLLIE